MGKAMTELWMMRLKRTEERREFREKVQRELLDYQQETHSQTLARNAQIGWLIAMGNFFALTEGVPAITTTLTEGNYKKEIHFFKKTIFPAIENFSIAQEETILICAELFEWVAQSLARQAKIPYQLLEEENPDSLFGEENA